jgi:hypothetical protein
MSTTASAEQQGLSANFTAPKTRSIFMHRMVQGNKIRWKFEVDDQMVIISEGPAENQELAIQQNTTLPGAHPVSVPPDALSQYKKILEERGIKYSITPTGQVIVNEVPNSEKMIMQFFDLHAPDPNMPEIPDLGPIRERYKQEYDQAGGAACPACQLNGLQRKYREILKARIANVATPV